MPDLNSDVKDQQLKVLQETIRNMQTQLMDNKMREKDNLQKLTDLEMRLKQANVKELLLKTKIVEAAKNSISSSISALGSETDDCDNDDIVCLDDDDNDVPENIPSLEVNVTVPPKNDIDAAIRQYSSDEKHEVHSRLNNVEAHIICLVSTFLVVHPFGANLDNIHSYVQRTIGNRSPLLGPNELEEILCQYSSIFRVENIIVGAASERHWKFCGFEAPTTATTATANNTDTDTATVTTTVTATTTAATKNAVQTLGEQL